MDASVRWTKTCRAAARARGLRRLAAAKAAADDALALHNERETPVLGAAGGLTL